MPSTRRSGRGQPSATPEAENSQELGRGQRRRTQRISLAEQDLEDTGDEVGSGSRGRERRTGRVHFAQGRSSGSEVGAALPLLPKMQSHPSSSSYFLRCDQSCMD